MIVKGEIFVNYAAFQSALKQYCRETNQEFVVAKSEVNNKNSDPSLPFKLKELKCAHHRRTKCRANLRLNLEKAGTHKNKYMIVTMNDEHTSQCPYYYSKEFCCSKVPANHWYLGLRAFAYIY